MLEMTSVKGIVSSSLIVREDDKVVRSYLVMKNGNNRPDKYFMFYADGDGNELMFSAHTPVALQKLERGVCLYRHMFGLYPSTLDGFKVSYSVRSETLGRGLNVSYSAL
jgi:hypothetical protein